MIQFLTTVLYIVTYIQYYYIDYINAVKVYIYTLEKVTVYKFKLLSLLFFLNCFHNMRL